MSNSTSQGPKKFQQLLQKLKLLLQHLTLFKSKNFSEDEEGQLIKDYLATRSSWMDKLSGFWVKRSLWSKAAIMISVTLFGGLMGLFAGAPTLITLVAGFISVSVHSLLTSHENSRHEDAKAFAKKAMTFNEEMKKKSQAFQAAANNLSAKTEELNLVGADLQTQAAHLDTQTKTMEVATQTLQNLVDEVTTATNQLIQQEGIAKNSLQNLAQSAEKSTQEVVKTLKTAEIITHDIVQLGVVVDQAKASEAAFTKAVHDFSNAMQQPLAVSEDECDEVSAFLLQLKADNDRYEALVKQKQKEAEEIVPQSNMLSIP